MSPPLVVPDLPRLRLKPKADARKIRHGYPWIYDSDAVLDRRTKALEPGTIAILEDAARAPLAQVAVTPSSRIVARVLDHDLSLQIDEDWFAKRFERALALRETLFSQPYYRLIHAEADGLPGVIVDRFDTVAVVQPNAAWAERMLAPLVSALVQATGVDTVLKNASGRTRALEGLDADNAVLLGEAPNSAIPVPMNGAIYMADVTGGQKTGLFFDQRPNHAFAASLSRDRTVLDVFSHVGGFGLAALGQSASHVLAIDASDAALSLARDGAERMGCADRFETHKSDAFAGLSALAEENRRFDVVICDPPAFAPQKKALEQGLRAYEKLARQAAPLVSDGGYLVLCSCSHAASLDKFRNASMRGIGRAGRQPRLIHTGFAGPDHPQLPQLGESGYLKALFFAL